MKKLNRSPLVAAIGSAIVASFAAGAVSAEENPFAITEMSQGYMQVAKIVPLEGAPAPAAKSAEMACGASMNMDKDASAKKTEGACGEAKCGGMMDGDKMKAGMENVCGAMMKGKEGACGAKGDNKAAAPADDKKAGAEMSCGAMMKGGASGMNAKDMEAACGAKMSPTK
jgi:uncharacterized low-complexity protein